MAKPRGTANNVRAGLFVLGAITIGFIFIVVLGGVREKLKPRDTYVVRFNLVEGASGLDVGSLVKIAGRTVGRISKITLNTEPRGSTPACVDCAVKIDKSIRFYGRPIAYLNLPLLGSGGELNFPGVGDPKDPALPTDGSAVIPGTLAPPAFLASAGYGDEQKTELQTMLKDGHEIAADVKAITADIRAKWPQWSDRFDSISANVDTAAKDLPKAIEDAKAAIASARAWFDENKDKLTRIVDNVESATDDAKEMLAHFNDESVEKIDALLEQGKGAMTEAREAVERLDRFVAEQTPNLRHMLGNFRLGSDQLKLTLAEVRRSPWRLLYRPDTRELEFELLYDSARAYADSVADLRAAGESLNAAIAAGGGSPGSAADLEALTKRLHDAMTTYGAAEESFLKLLTNPDAKPATDEPSK